VIFFESMCSSTLSKTNKLEFFIMVKTMRKIPHRIFKSVFFNYYFNSVRSETVNEPKKGMEEEKT
jgi:hypothetical protein